MFPRLTIFTALLMLMNTGLTHANTLVIYSSGPGVLIDGLVADFQSETGINANVFQSTTGQVLARLDSERSNPRADVVISASWDSAQDLKRQGLLLAYQSPNAEQVPDFLKDSHYVAQGVASLAMVWNRNSETPQPSDWSDVADDVYRNEVTMPDPSQSGAAFQLVSGLLTANGDQATWALLARLSDNGMIVPGPNARALNPVLQGAKSVVFGAVDYIALGQQADGEAIEVIFPTSGTVIAPRPMMILESTSNAELAQQFVDFVLSAQGQQRVAESYLMPVRSDVDGLRPGLKDLNLIDVDVEEMNARRAEILTQFRRAME